MITRRDLLRFALVIAGGCLLAFATSSHAPEWARIIAAVWGAFMLILIATVLVSGSGWIFGRLRRADRR